MAILNWVQSLVPTNQQTIKDPETVIAEKTNKFKMHTRRRGFYEDIFPPFGQNKKMELGGERRDRI